MVTLPYRARAEPGIANEIVGAVRVALAELGFDVGTLAAGSPDVPLVPGAAADALLERAAEYLIDDALGLSLASRITAGALGSLDYALVTSATLREALGRVSRFYGVATQRVRLELVDEPPVTRLTLHRVAGIAHSRHWIEFSLALIALRMRDSLGLDRMPVTRVAFRHGPPARRGAHDEFFSTTVQFDAACDELELNGALLDRELRTASPPIVEVLERQLRERALGDVANAPELDRTRRTLAALLDRGVTDLHTLAEALATSPRSLQRSLRDHGTSHTALLDELRTARALAMLDDGDSLVDVASRLGFSGASAFIRAYRRWTGTTPNARAR